MSMLSHHYRCSAAEPDHAPRKQWGRANEAVNIIPIGTAAVQGNQYGSSDEDEDEDEDEDTVEKQSSNVSAAASSSVQPSAAVVEADDIEEVCALADGIRIEF